MGREDNNPTVVEHLAELVAHVVVQPGFTRPPLEMPADLRSAQGAAQ